MKTKMVSILPSLREETPTMTKKPSREVGQFNHHTQKVHYHVSRRRIQDARSESSDCTFTPKRLQMFMLRSYLTATYSLKRERHKTLQFCKESLGPQRHTQF